MRPTMFIILVSVCLDITTASIATDATSIPILPMNAAIGISVPMTTTSLLRETDILELTSGITCKMCQCYSTLENNTKEIIFVDCRHNNLTKLPTLPENTTALDFSFNKIRNIENITTDASLDLIYLSLANNEIEKLTNDCFKLFPNLKLLDLSLNKIRYLNIHRLAFKSLQQLLFLDIKQDFRDIWTNESYPDQALSELTQLETLALDGLHQLEPGSGFLKLANLSELFMSGNYGRCNISVLNQSFFQFVNTAQNFSLYMSKCSLRSINDKAFETIYQEMGK